MTQPNSDTYTMTYSTVGSSWPRSARLTQTGGRIEPHARQFVYIDGGLWAGGGRGNSQEPRRNFALIYNNWAAQCDFVPHGEGTFTADGDNRAIYDSNVKPDGVHDQFLGTPENFDREVGPLNALLHALAGAGDDKRVKVNKVMRYQGGGTRSDTRTIYLFLPDMHLPVLRRDGALSNMAEFRTLGRYNFGGNIGEQDGWFDRYENADIWNGAATDLLEFLRRVSGFSGTTVHVVQLGDMIDLWIGLQCFFEDTESNDHVVRPRNSASMSAQEFMTHYLSRALGRQPPGENHLFVNSRPNSQVIQAMGGLGHKTFLYGNHDSYFSPTANLPRPDGIPARRGNFRSQDGRIFAEHGHQGDNSNRDGQQFGHTVTNEIAAPAPWIRPYEGMVNDTRLMGLQFATRRWIASMRGGGYYAFYVMGHTHVPCLATVTISGQHYGV